MHANVVHQQLFQKCKFTLCNARTTGFHATYRGGYIPAEADTRLKWSSGKERLAEATENPRSMMFWHLVLDNTVQLFSQKYYIYSFQNHQTALAVGAVMSEGGLTGHVRDLFQSGHRNHEKVDTMLCDNLNGRTV